MFVGLHADLRIEMFVVVTTFYTLDGMKSILLSKFVFFRSRLRLSLKNTNLLFYCFICFLRGVALRIITYPAPLAQGSLGVVSPLVVGVQHKSITKYNKTACHPERSRNFRRRGAPSGENRGATATKGSRNESCWLVTGMLHFCFAGILVLMWQAIGHP